jgi:uncharacterized protein YjbJ (UPF0337 family)
VAGNERAFGGLIGNAVGKARQTVDRVIGNDSLAREGRLAQVQSDAELEAERERAERRATSGPASGESGR